jgi:hypothetical protein
MGRRSHQLKQLLFALAQSQPEKGEATSDNESNPAYRFGTDQSPMITVHSSKILTKWNSATTPKISNRSKSISTAVDRSGLGTPSSHRTRRGSRVVAWTGWGP